VKQSQLMSLIESVSNVAVGFGVAVAAQSFVFPLFGIGVPLGTNVGIAAIFTIISIARSFVLRRIFEAVRVAQNRRLTWKRN
jgi:hypothetical protein